MRGEFPVEYAPIITMGEWYAVNPNFRVYNIKRVARATTVWTSHSIHKRGKRYTTFSIYAPS